MGSMWDSVLKVLYYFPFVNLIYMHSLYMQLAEYLRK